MVVWQGGIGSHRYFYHVLVFIFTCIIFLYFIRFSEYVSTIRKSVSETQIGNNIKYILFWNPFFSASDFNFGLGSAPFVHHHCKVKECYVTDNKNRLPMDQFDAIVFHGPGLYPGSDFPTRRSSHQIYAYFSQESPANHPVFSNLNGIFNITMTYRLDSDIQAPYFYVTDMDNRTVSPSLEPNWSHPNYNLDSLNKFMDIYKNKKKPVAWFSSNCKTLNKRERLVEKLQKEISVDVYGQCGPLSCPRTDEAACYKMLSNDYFFYLSFENSNCVDYVTEKVLTALEHDVIPVILGGADLTRYLPTGSYIDATTLSPSQLANKMKYLIKNPIKYLEYFWWKSYYKIGLAVSPFCRLCELLHNTTIKSNTYNDLQEWWQGTKGNPACVSNVKHT